VRDGQYIEALLYPSGQLKHLTYFWRERQDTGSYPLISSSEAQERLSRCDAVILRTLGPDNVVDNDLRQVRLAYMRTPGADGDYLMPTFVFQSDTMRGDFPSTVAIVPALADKFVAWVAPDRSAHMP
jgi:hypothetical protein